jgi:pimeloyl-ACP methyl ester carboxylesterase
MFVKAADADLLVHTFGSGPKVLVTHGGWVGSGELWLPVVERLPSTWKTVIYDHRGTGATISRSPQITFDQLVDDLFVVLDTLRIDRCVLAGESAGTMVVLEAALRQPQRFEGIVLVGARINGNSTPQSEQLLQGCRKDFASTMSAFVDACVPEEDGAAERAWGKKIVMRSNAKDAIDLMTCMDGRDFQPQLHNINLPTLVLHGERDVISLLANAKTIASNLPQAELAIAQEAGHVPTVTRPKWVADLIHSKFG